MKYFQNMWTPKSKTRKIVVGIQARIGSTRLPGKSMRLLHRRPLIDWVVERVVQSKKIDEIWLLTTTSLMDNPLASHFDGKIGIIRGSETDVRSRYESLFQQSQASHVIRVTGDCPLISGSLIDTLIDQYLSEDVEYGNILAQPYYPKSYPNGMNAELFSQKAFIKMLRMGTEERHKEHPTIPVDEWPDFFQIINLCPTDQLSRPKWKLSVDTLEDFERVERVIGQLGDEPILASIEQIIEVLDRNPLWL